MKINTDENLIKDILERGTEDVLVKENLERRLKSGKQLKIKLGIDPTSSYIHLGNAISLWKIRKFQDLGHQAILIIGDFTALIGDPSDKLNKRPMLSREEILKNMAGYKKLIGKIINLKKTKFVYNSKWLSKLKMEETINLAEAFTVNQMAGRRNFKERIDKGGEVSLREFLYPLLQGYDSYQVRADVEVGGFDQLFNVMAGRMVQKHLGQEEQDVLTTKMLDGTDGRKMSKSWGNIVSISDDPTDMFGKIMSLEDRLIEDYFLLCTNISIDEINKYSEDIKNNSVNPRDTKLKLAQEIVSIYHNEAEANKAKDFFVKTFSEKKIPEDIENLTISEGDKLGDILVNEGIVKSKSEWTRLIDSGAIKITKNKNTELEKIADREYKIQKTTTIQIGKKKFIKLIV